MAGWKATEIVEHISKRTEHRADDKIDLRRELFLALDEFCGERHFWWRRKRATFNLAIGTKTYDLSDPAGANAADFAEIDTAWLIDSDGVTPKNELTPVLGSKGQIKAALNTTNDTPSLYFIDTNTSPQTFSLQAPSNIAQKIFIEYFAIPMVTTADDTTDEDIPLVPGQHQWVLFYALERRVYEFLFGQNDPRYMVANARYQDGCDKAYLQNSWTRREAVSSRAPSTSVGIVRAHK